MRARPVNEVDVGEKGVYSSYTLKLGYLGKGEGIIAAFAGTARLVDSVRGSLGDEVCLLKGRFNIKWGDSAHSCFLLTTRLATAHVRASVRPATNASGRSSGAMIESSLSWCALSGLGIARRASIAMRSTGNVTSTFLRVSIQAGRR